MKMKKSLFNFFVFALVLAFANACNESIVNDEVAEELELKSAKNAKKGYIVVLQDAELDVELSNLKGYEKKQVAMKSASAKILKRAGVLDGDVEHVFGSALKGFSVKIPPGQLKKLQDDPSVKYIQEDRVIALAPPKDKPGKGGGGNDGGGSTTQETPWGITRVNGVSNYTGSNRAWVVDSGIDLDHPDLNVNTTLSRSFVVGGKKTTPDDENGHGSHVAGTIAAINNNLGVIGVAPGAEVVSCRVLDRRGSGSFSWTVAALDYIATDGVGQAGDVINMSLGPSSRYTDDAVDAAVQAVAAKGIKVSIAAGNESDDCSYYSPAHNNGPNIYTVSAMWEGDRFATEFSNFGSPVDYAAPGVYVLSTYKNGGYETLHGTSMAAPHVAGILLLGNVSSDGKVTSDPDGNADPIAVH